MPELNENKQEKAQNVVSALEESLHLFEEHRIKSFRNWPHDENTKCSIAEMAKAGFYYIGNGKDDDSAKCFVCGKSLDGWENTDDPWIEHQKHSANCKFLKLRCSEDEMTIEEFLDLFKLILKEFLTIESHKKERAFIKKVEKVRDIILKN